jgi:hypothetical protein
MVPFKALIAASVGTETRMFRIAPAVIGVLVVFGAWQAIAETRIEEAVRLSKLTISAIQCSQLADDDNEAQRLSAMGIAAGKQFLDLFANLSPAERQSADPNIATLWHLVPGPSNDFILGRVWELLEKETLASYDSDDKKVAKIRQQQLFDNKNCSLIR